MTVFSDIQKYQDEGKPLGYPLWLSVLLFLLLIGIGDQTLSVTFACSLLCYLILSFLDELGKKLNVLKLIAILALVQWLICPIIAYERFHGMGMFVKEVDFFEITFPAVLAFIFALLIPLNDDKHHREYILNVTDYLKDKPNLGLGLSITGFLMGKLWHVLPSFLKFFAYLGVGLIYVGLFYTLFSTSNRKNIVLAAVLGLTLYTAFDAAMFGEMVYWFALLVIVFMFYKPQGFFVKTILFGVGLAFLLLISSLKGEYRSLIWEKKGEVNKLGVLKQLLSKRILSPEVMLSDPLVYYYLRRANQGTFISKIYKHTPKKEEFAGGETIFLGMAGAFIPRFLWPGKPKGGGGETFERFTGHKLIGGTSMGLSPLGEAYANFGKIGGIFFIFLYGLILNLIFHKILSLCKKYPSLILWVPLIFLQTVKVETDLGVTLNSLIKGLMFTWIAFFTAKKVFKIKL